MGLLDALLLVALPVAAALGTLYLGSAYVRRELGQLRYDLAIVEDRLLREVKRRAAEARWNEEGAGPPADVNAAIAEIRKLAIGEQDSKGWLQGKEGGVQRGPV